MLMVFSYTMLIKIMMKILLSLYISSSSIDFKYVYNLNICSFLKFLFCYKTFFFFSGLTHFVFYRLKVFNLIWCLFTHRISRTQDFILRLVFLQFLYLYVNEIVSFCEQNTFITFIISRHTVTHCFIQCFGFFLTHEEQSRN